MIGVGEGVSKEVLCN